MRTDMKGSPQAGCVLYVYAYCTCTTLTAAVMLHDYTENSEENQHFLENNQQFLAGRNINLTMIPRSVWQSPHLAPG